jgi:hypothetical protein
MASPDLSGCCPNSEPTVLIFIVNPHVAVIVTTPKIINLHHDLNKKRSLVTVHWENDPEKRLGGGSV